MNQEQEDLKLPKGWRWVKLGKVCTKMSNGANAKQSDEKIGFPISRIETIWNEGIDWNRVKYIQETEKEFIEKYALKKNDILFSHINSDIHLGKTAIYKNQNQVLIHGINLLLIRFNEDVVADFFNYQFKYKRRRGEFSSIAQKSVNQSSINQPKLKSIDFVLPPKPIQKAIVSKIEELFSELDKSIETLRLAQQQLKTYRQAVLKWAFEGKLTKEWRKENGTAIRIQSGSPETYVVSSGPEPELLAAETLAEYQAASNNSGLPEGWNWVKFGEVHEIKSNLVNALEYLDAPHIAPDNISKGTAQLLSYNTIREDKVFSPKHKFYKGQIVYSKIRPNLAKVIIAPIDGLCSADMYPIDSLLDNRFTLYYMLTNFFVSKASNTESRTVLPKINKKGLNEIPFPLCSLKEQKMIIQEIESRLSISDKMEESIIQSLQQAEALRQSILKKSFEGKLVVEKKPTVYKPKSEYFYQVQLLGLIARASKKKSIAHGEMTIAKYACLLDRVYGVPTYYDYKRWHLGPYPPEMKKAVSNKKFFKKQNGSIEVVDEQVLFKSKNHYQDKIENAVDSLAVVFSRYHTKERAHKTELLATVCKVVEDIQTLDVKAVRNSMKEWKIDLENSPFRNKAEKFTESETEKCLNFLEEKKWDKKLVI